MVWCLMELSVCCLPLHISGAGHRACGRMERGTPPGGPGLTEVTAE